MAIKITVPKALDTQDAPSEVAIELEVINKHFPRIGGRIMSMWGNVALQQYLKQLIFDDRGDRQGFPSEVVTALLRIYEVHEPLVPKRQLDAWGNEVPE